MNNTLLQIKIKQRLNKLASMDYDNIEGWMVQEAFNKAQVEWVRRQLHGINTLREGDEMTIRRVDDLQVLLTTESLTGRNEHLYFQSDRIPKDYMQFKRVSAKAVSSCCPEKRILTVYLAQEADADLLMISKNDGPSYEWGETFCTMFGNKVRIYTNNEFEIDDAKLIYYRLPNTVQFKGVMDPETGKYAVADKESELKDDVLELIIDETAAILAGDIESMAQYQRETQNAERNN